MAKQLNVNLAFTADTSRAKQQIQDLQNQLSSIINMPTVGLGADMATKISQASRAAAELKVHLEQAMNPKTGTLDFSKLNQSLQKSGVSLNTYAAKLKEIGPEGQKAFSMLAQSISSAEVPIRRSNALLSELWVTMKNTARWQLTSSVLHGFIGAVQSAVGYTKDLNESLNNIRIVTGQSVEQMADFAKEANKAAKSLSTSTLNYTDAALIYYQQGLDATQVKERTDVTIKMANVSRQSAEEVSDQMTAVWNNFYDGSQSLEHFADVMTRLGADTASSSDEIAQGLEKFSAIADMIGLSFDNAAAALATVTATTRQSADIVGTAFKTIFARIQGLSLGETLDDGTNLNKYSKALDAVGINIKQQNGELKDMDSILEEMGAKWKTLSKDQQVALAQTVAGIRQYNQLIALMDNFDFYQKNLSSAQNSTGTLQEQADIYAESWQAATKRIKASLEEIYTALLNDKIFINLLNNIAKIINGVDAIIDSVGGLKGLLSSIAVIIGKLKFDSIVSGIQGAAYNIRNTFDGGKAMRQQKIDILKDMITTPEDSDAGLSTVENTNNQVITAQLKSQQFLIDNVKKLSTEEQKVLQILMDQQVARSKQAMTAAEAAQAAETRFDDASIMASHYAGVSRSNRNVNGQQIWGLETIRKRAEEIGGMLAENNGQATAESATLQKELDRQVELTIKSEKLTKAEADSVREYAQAAREKAKTKAILNKTTAEATREINKESIAQEKEIQKKKEAEQAEKRLEAAKEAGINSSKKNQKQLSISAAGFVNGSMTALSMVSAISMLSSAFDSLKDPNLGPLEKLSRVSMSLMFTLPMLLHSLKEWNKLLQISTTLANIRAITEEKVLGAIIKEQGAISLIRMAKMLENKEDKESVANVIAKVLVKKGLIKEEEKEAFITALLTKLKNADNAADTKDILLDTIKIFNKKKLNAELIKQLALKAKELLLAAKWLIIAALVAAAIWAIVYAYKAEERALKSAQEGANNAAKAYEDLKQKYDDLKASIDDYHNTKKAFEELEKGAEGYQEALEKANEAARKLIEANNLFDDWHYDENGLIVIDEKALAEAELAAQNRVNSASMNVAAANIKLNETKKDIVTPHWLEDTASEKLLGSINSEVFTSIKDAIDRGVAYTDLNAEDLGLTTFELNRLIIAIRDLGDKAESTYQELTSLNQSNEYYAEQLALGSIQTNGIGSDIEDEDQRDAYQKAYANLLAQDDNYIKQIEENADIAKKASDKELKDVMKRIRKSDDDLMDVGWQFNDEELMRLYMRDVQGWSDQDVKAAVYDSNKNGTGQMTLGDQTVTFNDQQMRNELLTKYLADEMAANLNGSDYNQDEIKAILDSVTALPDTNKGEVSSGENELLNALMNYKEGETVSVNWGELTPEEYAQFSEQINTMAVDNANAYAAAFSEQLVSPEAQQLMYENLQAQKEAAEIEAIFAEGAEATEISAAALESYADSLMTANEMTDDQRVLAAKAAVQHAKLAKGLNKVQKIYNDNIDTLKEADEASLDYHEAVGKLSEALTETFGIKVSPSFVKNTENLENIKKAAEGDIVALNELRKAINADFIAHLDLQTDGASEALTAELNRLSEEALNNPIGTELTLNDDKAIAALNEALYTGKATIEDIEKMFNNANLAMPEYKTMTVPGEVTHTTSTAHYKGPLGIEWDVTSETDTSTDRVIPYFGDQAPSIDDSGNMDYGGGGTDISVTSSGNTSSLENALDYEGDDGGNKKPSGKKYKPEEDRYYEITKEIEKQERALNRLQKAKDQAFGANKLKAIDSEIASIKKLKEANEELYRQQKENLEKDAKALLSLFPQADITNGYIANYNELLLKTTSEEQKKILDQYASTWEAMETTYDKLLDFDNQIKDLNYEKLNYELELKVDVEDAELKRLDHFLNKLSDDFYKMAESAVLMMDKIEPTSNMLSIYQENVNKLEKAYQNGDISQEKYIEGLKNARDAIYEQLEALNELDKQMLHYYEDTLSAATDELADHTDHMEHLTSVFEHYQNLLSIIGKSKNYEAMGNFLQGQADTIKDRLSVAQSYYDVLLQQKDEIQAELEAAIKSGDEAKIEMYQKEWDAIVDETDAAQEQVLSLTEEWAEAMKSVIQNNMEKIADTLEKTLAGGTTFDTLMDGFDKLNTRQEEYLTKTNQIYETNKLMRTASKALDETDNKVAKQKLKNFIDETKGLQETTQLSKYELEIQQAKYDLLLAQIALEEAQNAKSTVRLSRDNEGNFGYVYTADQNKIDDAQQAVDDADNKLYNLSLEGQQQYTEKYLQAEQAMYEELKQLQQDYLDGNIASEEEYELRKSQIQEHYLGPEGVLTTYSKLYNIAVQTDANATADYWGQEYGKMTQDTEAWKTAVNDYLLEIDDQIDKWKNVQNQANKEVQGALNNSKKATKELTDESKKLRDTLNNKVIPSIEKEIDSVRKQTDAYADQRSELLDLIATYERYLALLDKEIEDASRVAYDKNTDYAAVMSGYLAAGGKKTDSQYRELEAQREAKIIGEKLNKNQYGSKVGDADYNIQANNTWYKTKDEVNQKLKQLGISTFASGGYSGDWGPEGKLAILHEKELVLNQNDTQNLLSTVSLIRELVNMIDTQAASASLFNLISTPSPNLNANTLEQKVEITAEFPNVNDRYEIEEAFNNLINTASQYANRK